jgi:hypothetical protein
MLVKLVKHCEVEWSNIDMMQEIPNTGFCIIMTAVWRWKFESSRRFTIIQTVLYLVHLTVPIELFWIKELGTAMHYGCNDNIKGVGNLSSPGCSEINVMTIFNTIPITKRSHGHKRIQHPNVKKSSKPRTLQDTFNDLLSNIQKPLGIHHIRTILFSLPVNYLKDLRDFGLKVHIV